MHVADMNVSGQCRLSKRLLLVSYHRYTRQMGETLYRETGQRWRPKMFETNVTALPVEQQSDR